MTKVDDAALGAPTSRVPSSKQASIRYLSNNDSVYNCVRSGDTRPLSSILEGYSNDLLEQIVAATKEEQDGIWMAHHGIAYGMPEPAVKELFTFSPLLHTQSQWLAEKIIESLHDYEQLPDTDDLTSQGDDVLNQCKALLIVAQAAIKVHHGLFDGATPYFFGDSQLVDLIISNPDKAARIASIIYDREAADPENIGAILNAEAKALSDGII